jgi:hypothetical protein
VTTIGIAKPIAIVLARTRIERTSPITPHAPLPFKFYI